MYYVKYRRDVTQLAIQPRAPHRRVVRREGI